MAIGTPQVGAATASAAATTTAVPFPTTVNANDLCVLIGSVNSANLVTNPAGWTQQVSFYSTGNTVVPDLFVATKIAAGTEGGTSVTVTHGNTASNWQILAFPGVDQTTPMDATPVTQDTTTGSTTTSIAGITVATAGAALIYVAAANSTVATSTPPSGFTETLDLGSATRAVTAAYKLGQGTGATGTVANTWSTSQRTIGALLALRPAAGSSPASGTGAVAFAGTAAAAATAAGTGTVAVVGTGAASGPGAAGTGVVAFAGTAAPAATAAGSGAFSFSGTSSAHAAVIPQLQADFEDGTTGAFGTVQGATVGTSYAHDGSKGVRLAPDGSGFAALDYNIPSGQQIHPWAAFRGWWRPVVKTADAPGFNNNAVLLEIGNTLTAAPKGQLTIYTQNGDLGVDFNTTDFSAILPAFTTGSWHLIEIRCYFGATTFTAYVRIDGTEYVHTSAATQTPASVRALWMKYSNTVTDATDDWDSIKFWYGDSDPGYLDAAGLPAGIGVLDFEGSVSAAAVASGSGAVTFAGTAAPRASTAGSGAVTYAGAGTSALPGSGTGAVTYIGTASARAPAAGAGVVTYAGVGSAGFPGSTTALYRYDGTTWTVQTVLRLLNGVWTPQTPALT